MCRVTACIRRTRGDEDEAPNHHRKRSVGAVARLARELGELEIDDLFHVDLDSRLERIDRILVSVVSKLDVDADSTGARRPRRCRRMSAESGTVDGSPQGALTILVMRA